MLVESGRVVAVEEDGVWVETLRKTTCGACSARKGCGHGLLNEVSAGSKGLVRILVGDDLKASQCHIDDQVEFTLPEEVILRGSLVVYIMPLLTMLGGAALLAYLTGSFIFISEDVQSLLGAIGGFVLGVGLVRLHSRNNRDNVALQPTLLRRVGSQTNSVSFV
ncbi:MAG: SoxR reducing system RseC family protein [Halioglobus sp.]